MENVIIKGEQDSPSVDFNFETGHLGIEGRSLPSNPHEFYKPIMDNLKEFLAGWENDICFDIKMSYFNTASSKQILELLNLFIPDENKSDKKLFYKKLTINWYHDGSDEDMAEAGQEYADLLQVKDHPNIVFNVLEKIRVRC